MGLRVTASRLAVLEVSAANRGSGSPPSEDGRAAQREHRRPADDGGAVGEGVDSLPTMGVEEAAVVCGMHSQPREEMQQSRCLWCHAGSWPRLVMGF